MSVAIPLYAFLFLYLVFLTVFLAFSIVNFYHIVITASFTLVSFTTSFFILALTVLTFYLTTTFLTGVDWQTTVLIFDSSWFGGPTVSF
ncbi:MAG: hypothetical protein UV82_C0010G0028 [Candidatus Magasanikbacteria bacterium GW2011_GWD2_43_18]|uniref:Uncharacterized protein n=1 Tax=Candidatus Magasanikbacteria bacterium GW2011_GWE2_42_7 TaxID=1619052 RepID=A0A0G1EB21_9BACT|nr:MAG: hypothetical protein UV18_C0005G0156 [Candidatus Magasanikbacteria bacterium GW2011_GWC2_42_27]KKS71793.1 MAG: hypothetical protein UV42_C0019G0017 [Candidatus Magasanikbacteria bacterium GW2011_GWE2_42_7]KKT04212.1 MAG: hypothetical protein UV82_C0010G0028 [Candidatus Magasanikbacteria bacterium GW2011_GWD2_43_18]KKT25906.1 MAG: hypothetical protein UW10_C0003G0067 [Candidatus Magasanikbacteria bacterium GW2011_GWA2_43_9]HBB37883.1 hypothetical protein [Candidatus Magasanikbacteria bac